MSANERRKKGAFGVFNTSFAQNRLQRQSPNSVLSYWGGWVLVSYLYFIPVADKYDTVLLRNTKQRVETKYTQNAPAQFPADGGCCFGFASKFLTELSASKCENRPAQKIDTHTLIYLTTQFLAASNHQLTICVLYFLSHCKRYLLNIVIYIFLFSA